MSTTSPRDGRDVELPAEVRAEVDDRLAHYESRTRHLRETLLPPGGQAPRSYHDQVDGQSYRPMAVAALRAAGDWWAEAFSLAWRCVELGREVDGGQRDALHRLAARELSEAARARHHTLTVFARVMVDERAAEAPPVDTDGAVTLAGARLFLTGAAVAGPPPALPDVRLTTMGLDADPEAMAERLRSLAGEVERDGAYPTTAKLADVAPATTHVVLSFGAGADPLAVAASLRAMAADMAKGASR